MVVAAAAAPSASSPFFATAANFAQGPAVGSSRVAWWAAREAPAAWTSAGLPMTGWRGILVYLVLCFGFFFFERLKRGGGHGGKKVEGEMATNERKKRKPRFLKKRKPGVTNKFLTLLPPPTTPLRFPSPRSLAPPTFHK